MGEKRYELSNHLGNVLAVITDRRFATEDAGATGNVKYYEPDVVAAQDYDPFGMLLTGRSWEAGSGYRYGFNGKEYDSETYGNGNIYDYGFRIYNPRLGKFLSVDPLHKNFPWYTPYQFAGNKPIWCLDLDGLEDIFYQDEKVTNPDQIPALDVLSETELAGGYLGKFQDPALNNSTNWAVLNDPVFSNGYGVTYTIPAGVLYINYYTYQQGVWAQNEQYKSTAIESFGSYVNGDKALAEQILNSNAAAGTVGNTEGETNNLMVTLIGTNTYNDEDFTSMENNGTTDLQKNEVNNLWKHVQGLGHEFVAHVGYLVIDKWPDNEDGEHNRFESNDKDNPEIIHSGNNSSSTPIDALPTRAGSENSDGAKLYRETQQVIQRKKN